MNVYGKWWEKKKYGGWIPNQSMCQRGHSPQH